MSENGSDDADASPPQEWGSDFVVDLLEAYGFDYVSFNPGASFRGIEESLVNYHDNESPTVVETPHEGLSVSIAHGHAKATGEPALCILHNVVGTLHGAMGLYNAYIDRVPILALSGTGPMRKSERRPWIDWIHSALVQGNIVREYVKWDDQPDDIDGVAESVIRAHRIANTAPKGPAYVTLDHSVQECALDEPMELPDLDDYRAPTKAAPDPAAVERAADLLADAESPVVLVDQVGDSREAVDDLVDLAEELGAPVIDPRHRRFNFPNTHPLCLSGREFIEDADVILGVDVWSYGQVTKETDKVRHENVPVTDEDVAIIDVGTQDLEVSSLFPNYYALEAIDVPILADSELAVGQLADAVADRMATDADARRRAAERRETYAEVHADQREQWWADAEAEWDDDPISPARIAGELWDVVRDEEWVIVNGTLRGWPHKLWDIDEFDQYIGGGSGGGGVGYGVGAAIGGALAYDSTDRIPINLQTDGDLMFYPNALWVMGHYEIPLLSVVHNNRSLYNSTNHRIKLADHRGRDASHESAMIGTGLVDPTPDYATIAEGMGVNGYGPIEDPDEIVGALEQALEDVKNGQPALVDVISKPR